MSRLHVNALFDVADAIERILAQECDPETGEITERTLEQLDALEGHRDRIALDVAAYLKGERCEAEKIQRVADELSARAKGHRDRAERLLEYVGRIVPAGDKLKDERVTISWSPSSFTAIDDAKLIPEAYWRIPPPPPPELDKRTLLAVLRTGQAIPGARLQKSHTLKVK
jgi:hypothetical protein